MKNNFMCFNGDCSDKNCRYFRVFGFCDVSEMDCVWYGKCIICEHHESCDESIESCDDCIFGQKEKQEH